MTQSKPSGEGRSVVTLLQHYLKLEVTEKLSLFAIFLIISLVVFAFGTCALFFVCSGLAKSLAEVIGSESLANYIIGGALVLALIIFFTNRKSFVERPVLRWVSTTMTDMTNREEDDDDI